MANKPLLVTMADLRGRNGYDAPGTLSDNIAAEMLNMVPVRGTLGQKRRGSAAQTITGTFSGYNALSRFIPGQSDAAAELHFLDRNATTKYMRVAAGTAATELTLADAVSSVPQDAVWATINGKHYVFFDSTVNRAHVYRPNVSATRIDRVGLQTPSAPTAADQGSGTLAVTLRYYRVRWLTQVGGVTKYQSNAGASVAFTPSGTGQYARVTRPSLPSETETHWMLEGSIDNAVFFEIPGATAIAVATSTYDDASDPDTYADGTAAADDGADTPLPSAKFAISTGDRLVMYGAYESATGTGMPPKNGRVWWTPVLGTTDRDDDERISNTLTVKGYTDVSRDAGSEDRALVGPMDGQVFVFQSRGVTMLVPTPNNENPYRKIPLDTNLGAVSHHSCFVGQDENGQPCIYFLDPERGPYRYGAGGFWWLGNDIKDKWDTVNLSASNKVAHGVYDFPNRRCLWWVATGASNDPDLMLVFEVMNGQPSENQSVRGGWAVWTGDFTAARASVMFAETLGASMSRRLKPYGGFTSALLRGEDASATADNGVAFQSYAISKAWDIAPASNQKVLTNAWLQAKAASATIAFTLIPNYGDRSIAAVTQSIAAAGSETRVLKNFPDASLRDAFTMQFQIGDSAAISNNWTLDALMAKVEVTTDARGNSG